jgi:hypothetical protein
MILMLKHADVVKSIEGFVEKNLDLLKEVSEGWQPSDILPDMVSEEWREQIQRLRDQARGVPDEVLIVLVGNTVTEEALPSYQRRRTSGSPGRSSRRILPAGCRPSPRC